MKRTRMTVQRIGIFCGGLLLCGLMGMAGGLLGAGLAGRQQSEPKQLQQEETPAFLPETTAPPSGNVWHNQIIEETAGENGTDTEPVFSVQETINAETEYILREKDLLNGSEVETSEDMPDMYIGMTREQFLTAMENYEAAPPLSEKERGFVSLEVLSFAPSRVVVQMNYRYVQPSESFYIVAINDLLVVYLEDRETVYQYTNIHLSQLPEQLQQEIIKVMYISDEESLYDFLENYTS